MSENRRYYWLKLQENFFDDDTIDYIESQESGEKYVLFYLKLCLKALKNGGKLIRYVGEMLLPYDDIGLAKLTRTDVNVARSALILFSKIGLIKKLETGELFLTQLNEMVGTETQKAKYMRQRRAEQKGNNVTPMLPECYTDIELDIELEKEKELEKELELEKEKELEQEGETTTKRKRTIFVKPTVEEVNQYCTERNNGIDAQYFVDYYESKGWMIGKNKMKDWKACVRTWETKNKQKAPKHQTDWTGQATDAEYMQGMSNLETVGF